MKYVFNSPDLVKRRKRLRNNATEEEKKLWQYLRCSRLGHKFTRQHSVGCFILDFYCPKFRLGIELDGMQHGEEENKKYDENRSYILEESNVMVLRFWNWEVTKDVDGVCSKISEELEQIKGQYHP